ncbi:MAG: WD40 repeat domain-containing protein [Armatimonadota bacterium]|nr:WD40 repeat domain-containing protein [Armatimonadota bacterium]
MPSRLLPFLFLLATLPLNHSNVRAQAAPPSAEPQWQSYNQLALSPDGKWVAADNRYKSVVLYEAHTGKVQFSFPQVGSVTGLAFSPDSSLVAACNTAGAAGLWEVQTGRLVVTLPHPGSVVTVAFSPDGKTLVSGVDKQVFLWDTKTGARRATLIADISSGGFLAVSPDSRWLATGRFTKVVQLWDLTTGRLGSTLDVGGNVNVFAFSPDSETLAVGGGSNFIGANSRKLQLWNVKTGLKRADLPVKEVVEAAAFSHDGKTLAAGNALWDTATGKLKVQLEAKYMNMSIDGWVHIEAPDGLTFSPDDLTVVGRQQFIFTWDTQTGKLKKTLRAGAGVTDEWDKITDSPDGSTVAVVAHGSVRLWDAATGTSRGTFGTVPGRVLNMVFSPDGSVIAAAGEDHSIHLWNTHTQQLQTTMTGNAVTAYAVSPNGRMLAAGGEDCLVRIWRTTDGLLLRTMPGHSGAITAVAFSPDGIWMATASLDRTVRLWDVATAVTKYVLKGSTRAANDLIFSPDSQTLAMDSQNSPNIGGRLETQLWSVKTGQLRATLKLADSDAIPARFSPDSSFLVTGGGYWSAAELWDVRTGRAKFQVAAPTSVTAVIFSANSKMVGVAGWTNVGGEGQPQIEDRFDVVRTADGTPVPWKQTDQLNLFHDEGGPEGLALSPDGRLVAAASDGNKVLVWNRDGKIQATIDNATAPLVFSPDTSLLLASSGNTIVGWDLRAGKAVPSLSTAMAAMFPRSLAQRITVTGTTISLWDPVTGELARTLDASGKM